ncbi:hypothetical protein NHX12_018228 [Muraenolepis orangiensis]|uniref:Uncharacterized protein n=1 Tax=Muraenolepis orangiensis TaxID=630683 RepID=A0A9Q0F0L1_9TELE|nr:hypothetical protein NHX12_018228 [Muraenolepis orangiensis]
MGSKTTGGDSSFHVQLASIVEVLANTAVAEICKLVDDGYALLHLEISQNHREIDTLRRRLLLAKLQGARRGHATARTRVETHGALQATRRPSPRVSVRSRSGGVAVYFRTTGKERLSGGTEEEDVAAAEEEEEEEPVIVKVEGRGAQGERGGLLLLVKEFGAQDTFTTCRCVSVVVLLQNTTQEYR